MNPDVANKNAEKASEKVATTLASVWSLVPSLTSLTPRGLRYMAANVIYKHDAGGTRTCAARGHLYIII
jgi:hypothetical protein